MAKHEELSYSYLRCLNAQYLVVGRAQYIDFSVVSVVYADVTHFLHPLQPFASLAVAAVEAKTSRIQL